jgi:parallel beta-helix repeat protein
VKFANLVLDGLSAADNVICVGTGSSKAHHIEFRNIEVKNSGHIGVFFHGNNNIFTGGSVHDIGNQTQYPNNLHYGFYIEGTDNLIENAEIYNIDHYGIHNYSGYAVKANRNTYRNNRLHHTSRLVASYSAIIIAAGDSSTAYNNVIYSNTGHGILVSPSSTNSTVYNNTVYGNAQSGIWVQSSTPSAIVLNNIVYGNSNGSIYNQGTNTTLSNNLTTDPRFVDAAAFAFNLQATSPAINAGVTVSQITTDIKGTPRPQEGVYDIGAYEAGTKSSLAPPRNLKVQ